MLLVTGKNEEVTPYQIRVSILISGRMLHRHTVSVTVSRLTRVCDMVSPDPA